MIRLDGEFSALFKNSTGVFGMIARQSNVARAVDLSNSFC